MDGPGCPLHLAMRKELVVDFLRREYPSLDSHLSDLEVKLREAKNAAASYKGVIETMEAELREVAEAAKEVYGNKPGARVRLGAALRALPGEGSSDG